MKKTWVKIVSVIASLALIAALGFCVVWTCTNFSRVQDMMSGTGIYNKQDLDNAFHDGYDTGVVDKNGFETLINDYRDKISVLRTEKAELEKLRETAERVPDLENQIAELQQSITYFEDLIIALGAENLYVVKYMVDGELYASRAVQSGEKLETVADPTLNSARFIGWSLDGKKTVNVNEIEVTSNLILMALFEHTVTVKYYTKIPYVVDGTTTFLTIDLTAVEIYEGHYLRYYDLNGDLQTLNLRVDDTVYLSRTPDEEDERYWNSITGESAYVHSANIENGELALYKYSLEIDTETGRPIAMSYKVGDTSEGTLTPFDPDRLKGENQ